MALQWADNFQQYGLTASHLTDGVYAENNHCTLVADPDPAAGGITVLNLPAGAGGALLRKVLTTAGTTIGTAQRLYIPTLPVSTNNLIHPLRLRDVSNNDIFSLRIETDGRVSAYRGNPTSGTLLGTSANPAVTTKAWQHFETNVVISATVGSVEVKVGGITVLLLTNQNTGAVNCTQVTIDCFNFPFDGTQFYVKDYVIRDASGTHNTSFLGSCFVYSMRPDSDVSGAWSIFGGAGSAWASINESDPNDDTKYIYSGWPAAVAQVCGLTDLPIDATTVLGMVALVRSRKSDGGDGNLQVGLISAGTTGTGADRPITTAYTYWSDIFEEDPHTSAPWSVPAANAATIQLNRTL